MWGSNRREPNCNRYSTSLAQSLATLSSLRSRIRKNAEGDLLKLAISIARRVLHRELTLDPESIEGLIRVALEKLQSRELCRVRVHPDQEQCDSQLSGTFLEFAQGGTGGRFLPAVRRRSVRDRAWQFGCLHRSRSFAKSNAALRTACAGCRRIDEPWNLLKKSRSLRTWPIWIRSICCRGADRSPPPSDC